MGNRGQGTGCESTFTSRQTLSELASLYLEVRQTFQFRHGVKLKKC